MNDLDLYRVIDRDAVIMVFLGIRGERFDKVQDTSKNFSFQKHVDLYISFMFTFFLSCVHSSRVHMSRALHIYITI